VGVIDESEAMVLMRRVRGLAIGGWVAESGVCISPSLQQDQMVDSTHTEMSLLTIRGFDIIVTSQSSHMEI
jgi:hypothetical protein